MRKVNTVYLCLSAMVIYCLSVLFFFFFFFLLRQIILRCGTGSPCLMLMSSAAHGKYAAPTSVLDTWPPRPTSWSSSQVVLWLTQAVAWLQPSRALARSLARSSEVARIVHEVGSDVGETLHDLATSRQVFQLFGKPGATWRPCTPRDEVFTRSAAR